MNIVEKYEELLQAAWDARNAQAAQIEEETGIPHPVYEFDLLAKKIVPPQPPEVVAFHQWIDELDEEACRALDVVTSLGASSTLRPRIQSCLCKGASPAQFQEGYARALGLSIDLSALQGEAP
jgi:hypothetical protein